MTDRLYTSLLYFPLTPSLLALRQAAYNEYVRVLNGGLMLELNKLTPI